MSPTDEEIHSGWMTTRDAELFGVLARGLTDDERRKIAEAITRADTQADQQARRSRGHDPTATPDPTRPLVRARLRRSDAPPKIRTRSDRTDNRSRRQ